MALQGLRRVVAVTGVLWPLFGCREPVAWESSTLLVRNTTTYVLDLTVDRTYIGELEPGTERCVPQLEFSASATIAAYDSTRFPSAFSRGVGWFSDEAPGWLWLITDLGEATLSPAPRCDRASPATGGRRDGGTTTAEERSPRP